MAETENIAVVILAAGESSRMKQAKQLLPWGTSTLLGNAIKEALESNSEKVYVVLGAKVPIILTSRSDSDMTKFLTLCASAVYSQHVLK